MLTKEQKREQSEQLRVAFGGVNTLFLLNNTGLSVNEINELRSSVRTSNATYKVVKNSVVRLAIAGTEFEKLSPYLVGPKALAFTAEDGVALGKALKEFIKTHPKLSFQEAFLEGQVLEATQAEKIAELPSRGELVAKLLFVLQSPMRRLVTALNGPIQSLAGALGQIADQKEKQGS
jgi:large subunit ribosomal protein L10